MLALLLLLFVIHLVVKGQCPCLNSLPFSSSPDQTPSLTPIHAPPRAKTLLPVGRPHVPIWHRQDMLPTRARLCSTLIQPLLRLISSETTLRRTTTTTTILQVHSPTIPGTATSSRPPFPRFNKPVTAWRLLVPRPQRSRCSPSRPRRPLPGVPSSASRSRRLPPPCAPCPPLLHLSPTSTSPIRGSPGLSLSTVRPSTTSRRRWPVHFDTLTSEPTFCPLLSCLSAVPNVALAPPMP